MPSVFFEKYLLDETFFSDNQLEKAPFKSLFI